MDGFGGLVVALGQQEVLLFDRDPTPFVGCLFFFRGCFPGIWLVRKRQGVRVAEGSDRHPSLLTLEGYFEERFIDLEGYLLDGIQEADRDLKRRDTWGRMTPSRDMLNV